MDNAYVRRMMLGSDARSNRGIFSRGKAVYNGTSAAPKRGARSQSEVNRQALERRMRAGTR